MTSKALLGLIFAVTKEALIRWIGQVDEDHLAQVNAVLQRLLGLSDRSEGEGSQGVEVERFNSWQKEHVPTARPRSLPAERRPELAVSHPYSLSRCVARSIRCHGVRGISEAILRTNGVEG